ncbi:MAG: hypothetical protein WAN35_14680 [Terracidiphilus sp.]
MSVNGDWRVNELWDSAASVIFNVYDAYGWIVPAVFLSLLFLLVIGFIAWAAEDLPVECLEGFGGIWRWVRRWWRE